MKQLSMIMDIRSAALHTFLFVSENFTTALATVRLRRIRKISVSFLLSYGALDDTMAMTSDFALALSLRQATICSL